MKKTLKRALTALIAAALLLSCLPLGILAATESEYDRLWEEKMQAEKEKPLKHWEYGNADYPFVSLTFLSPIVLLYTDVVDEITVEVIPYYNEQGFASSFSFLSSTYLFSDDAKNLLWYVPEFEEVCRDVCYANGKMRELIPPLYILIREYGVEKEELLAAYQKMKTEPEAICALEVFSDDEQWERLSSQVRRYQTQSSLPAYLIDALYLENEAQAKSLVAHWYTAVVDGEVLTSFDLFYNCKYSFEELKARSILTKEFRRMMDEIEAHEAIDNNYEMSEKGRILYEQLQVYLAENPENDPPKTGDPTAAYALIFTLAALPFAGFGVAEWKRRRRAV